MSKIPRTTPSELARTRARYGQAKSIWSEVNLLVFRGFFTRRARHKSSALACRLGLHSRCDDGHSRRPYQVTPPLRTSSQTTLRPAARAPPEHNGRAFKGNCSSAAVAGLLP